MMEKQGHSQLELFSRNPDSVGSKIREGYFLSYVRRYEKILLLIITFVITGVISFSLGVKQGKKINLAEQKKISPAAEKKIPPTVEKKVSPAVEKAEGKKEAKPEIPSEIPPPETPTQLAKYTIQVASFRTNKQAQEEAQTLKQKGFTALVLPKGSYIIVCVGNFSDKNTAKSLMSKLKKRYADCYIRGL